MYNASKLPQADRSEKYKDSSSENKESSNLFQSKVRDSNTSKSTVMQRRMDSLARLIHSRKVNKKVYIDPKATAVAFDHAGNLYVSHNFSSAQQFNQDKNRIAIIKRFLNENFDLEEAAIFLSIDSSLPPYSSKGLSPYDRIKIDLEKIKKTFDGLDVHRVGDRYTNIIRNGLGRENEHIDLTNSEENDTNHGVIHAEASILSTSHNDLIGVNKLSCGNCFEYAKSLKKALNIRGTHGNIYPKWKNPETSEINYNKNISRINEYPSDSESN